MKLGPPILRKYTGILEEGAVIESDMLSVRERRACAVVVMVMTKVVVF
jgi:hypothetical protein